MVTPMGAIYTTNITPDPETGIGGYTEADFASALRKGVAKDGHNLYPAMPYPSYAKLKDDDVKALYAYFMHGVEPVKQANRPSDIRGRSTCAGRSRCGTRCSSTRRLTPTSRPGTWCGTAARISCRAGHCGSCHTPRGVGFQEKALDEGGAAFLSGAPIDNWFASNLTGEPNTGPAAGTRPRSRSS